MLMPQAYYACAQSFLALLQTDKNLFYKWIYRIQNPFLTYAVYSIVFESTYTIKAFSKGKNITDSISLKSI